MAKLSLRDLAAKTYLSKTTLSDWENNKVDPDLEILEQVFESGGTLEDLYLATNKLLPPRWEWAHNYQNSNGTKVGGPVWVLLRPGPDSPNRVRAKIRWGLFGVVVDEQCNEDGIFITCRVSTPHPAAFVYFYDGPGWANFGRGRLPNRELGVVAHPELRIIDAVEVSESVRRLVKEGLRYMGRSFVGMMIYGDPKENREVALTKGLLKVDNHTTTAHRVTNHQAERKIEQWHQFDHNEYLQLRQSLRLSREAVVRIINAEGVKLSKADHHIYPNQMVAQVITIDQLKYFEETGRTTVSNLSSRLDMVYRLDGFSCREEVSPTSITSDFGKQRAKIEFPIHYVGPVVVTAMAPTDDEVEGEITLYWGPWKTSIIVQSGIGVTCRKDKPGAGAPLEVEYPLNWIVRASIGYSPDAVSINNDIWDPRDIEAGASIIERYIPLFTSLWRGSKEEGSRLPWR